MKPSERIKEIAYGVVGGYGWPEHVSISAIMTYLDEEWEKSKESEQFNKDFALHDATSKLQ